MAYWKSKQSNLTSYIFKDEDRLQDYLIDVDRDITNLFYMSAPFYQFGTGSNFAILTYTSTNYVFLATVGGWNITNTLLYAGSGATYMGLQPGTGIWMGNASFASAPFSVDPNGQLTAHAGRIGGWYIGTTTLSSTNINLDSGSEQIVVGDTASTYITINGTNTYMQTSDFVSGPLGVGWSINKNLAEFNNIRARGKITTATFEKDNISAIGGSFLVANSAILTVDMTAADNSTLSYSSDTSFATNDILRIKDLTNDEWFAIAGSTSAYTLTVTRDRAGDYSSNANPIWKKGTCVVNYGSDTNGLIFMTASEANAPHIDVLTHAGAPWTTTTTRMRMGNLNGFLGYTTNLYGIAIGETNKYLKYDPTNGLQIKGTIVCTASSTYTGVSISTTYTDAKATDPNADETGSHTALNVLSVSNIAASYIAAWAHGSDVTLIDGGDIYTGSINATKLSISKLSDISSNTGYLYTALTGARFDVFPDANTGFRLVDDDGNNVLEALVGGTDVGDVTFGYKNSYTVFLLHCDGNDTDTYFEDSEKNHIITTNGDAQVDTAQKVFGTGSLLLDGTGDYLSTPDNADWNFGAGDFTIDLRVRFNSVASSQTFASQYDSATEFWWFGWTTDNELKFQTKTAGAPGGQAGNYYCSFTPDVNTWYHIAIVRSGSSCYMFVGGVSQSVTQTYAWDTLPDLTGDLNIGRYGGATNYVNGWLDEIRISKGIARWTATFTIPSSAYIASSYAQWDKSEKQFKVEGEILTGKLDISTSGYIKCGQTSWGTGTGFWLEYNAGTPRFSFGSATDNLEWDGTELTVSGVPLKGRVVATVGTYIEAYSDGEEIPYAGGAKAKAKEIRVARDGAYTIKFDVWSNVNNGGSGQIYRNGSPVGTEYYCTAGTVWQTKEEDISGWTAGDTCELWWDDYGVGNSVNVRNFRLYSATPITPVVTTGTGPNYPDGT